MNRVAVRWSVDVELSFAQALYVVALGEATVDPTVKTVLTQSVQTINDRLLTHSLDLASFWETLRTLQINRRHMSPLLLQQRQVRFS